MARFAHSVLSMALLSVAVVGCFVQPRSDEELEGLVSGVPELSGILCYEDSECDDADPCTDEFCTYAGRCAYPIAAEGAPCGNNDALTCNGEGKCVGCGDDASLCSPSTFCMGWTCVDDQCVGTPTSRDVRLPYEEQILGDCSVRVCTGSGGITDQYSPYPDCESSDCASAPDGAPCGSPSCGIDDQGYYPLLQRTCEAGSCLMDGGEPFGACEPGEGCELGECKANCIAGADCAAGAICENNICEPARCDLICAATEAKGCAGAPFPAPCEESCRSFLYDADPSCKWTAAAPYVHCLQELPDDLSCAERFSSCAKELIDVVVCEGQGVGLGPFCNHILDCVSTIDACDCADICYEALYAEHCVPSESVPGMLDCTCAKDGVTVATCQGIAGCEMETGCCSTVFSPP